MATPGILQEMTIDDVRAFKAEVVVVGIGSTEPHGPILPYGTDFFQCDGLCRRAVAHANGKGGRVLMYPTLPVGNNVNFKPFPFACRVSVRTLMLTLLDILRALEEDGIRKVVLVNGHGGNTDAINAVLREHFDLTPPGQRAFVCVTEGMLPRELQKVIEDPSPHGGESETCRMMYLRPELVRADKLQNLPVGKTIPEFPSVEKAYFVRPWHLYVPMGGGGGTRKSTAEKGRLVVEGAATALGDYLLELSNAPWNPNFPFPPS